MMNSFNDKFPVEKVYQPPRVELISYLAQLILAASQDDVIDDFDVSF